jgi:hypothetical protein
VAATAAAEAGATAAAAAEAAIAAVVKAEFSKAKTQPACKLQQAVILLYSACSMLNHDVYQSTTYIRVAAVD